MIFQPRSQTSAIFFGNLLFISVAVSSWTNIISTGSRLKQCLSLFRLSFSFVTFFLLYFFCSFRFSLFLFIWWNGIVLQRCMLREMELELGWKTTSSLPDCWHRAARSLFVGLFGFLFSEKCSSYVSCMMLFIAAHRQLYTVAISRTFADV